MYITMAVCVTQTLRLDTTHEHSNYKLVVASAGTQQKRRAVRSLEFSIWLHAGDTNCRTAKCKPLSTMVTLTSRHRSALSYELAVRGRTRGECCC